MASKGSYISGTDGTDFTHRQKVVNTHISSVSLKVKLKSTFYLHFLLYLLIVLKLSEDILDRMDIFILELQELEIPKPDLWEWTYGVSFLFTIVGARAIRTNSVSMMKFYILCITLTAFGPIVMSLYQYIFDFWKYQQEGDLKKLQYVWHDLPLGPLFGTFGLIALQVHLFQLYYAHKLYKAWSQYGQIRQNKSQNSLPNNNAKPKKL